MRRSTTLALALSLAAAALLAPGCTWSDLDAEFLAAMPERVDLHVDPPTSTAQSSQGLQSGDLGQSRSGLQADAFLNLDNMAKQLNAWIDGLTGGLDLVRQNPPSIRENDRRTWGPWEDKDHPGKEMRVVVAKTADGYTYSVEWRAKGSTADFVPVITGKFAGETAAGGSGSFTLDMDKAREADIAGPSTDPKIEIQTFTLGYTHDAQAVTVTLDEVVLRVATGATETLHFGHQRNADQSGAFDYTYTMPNNGWTVAASARWLSSHAGRVDGTAKNWFGDVVARQTDCWDENLEVVYHFQDYDCGPLPTQTKCETGDASKCALAP